MVDVHEPKGEDMLIRGVRVHYYETGAGPPLLLIHGFLVSGREWLPVVPALAAKFRVIVPDLPGLGESEKPTAFRYDREGFADTLCDLMAGLDVPRAHVAGHSFGAAVASTLAADHPERVDRLVLIDANSHRFEAPWKARLPLVPVLGPILFKQIYNRALFHDYFKTSVYAPGFQYNRSEVDRAYEMFDPAEAREAAYRILPLTLRDFGALGAKLGKIRARTLVLWGELDPMFPVAQARQLAREIDGARLEVLPGCGHAPNEEMPERTSQLMIQHLSGSAA